MMEIRRIDGYDDPRFDPAILRQHGAFLADGEPYQIAVTGPDSAVVHGKQGPHLPAVIEAFRFYAEHITRFFDEAGGLLAEFPPVQTFPVFLADIQPSQFAVDAEKLAAVQTFVSAPEDVVIPLIRHEGRYVSLDGHTRLALAARLGFAQVQGFITQGDACILDFVRAAQARGVTCPMALPILSHEEYRTAWDRFCDDYFAALPGKEEAP